MAGKNEKYLRKGSILEEGKGGEGKGRKVILYNERALTQIKNWET